MRRPCCGASFEKGLAVRDDLARLQRLRVRGILVLQTGRRGLLLPAAAPHQLRGAKLRCPWCAQYVSVLVPLLLLRKR